MLRNSRFRIAPISLGVRAMSIAVMLLLGLAVAGLRPGTADRVIAQQPATTAETAEVTAPPEDIPVGELDLAYVLENAQSVLVFRPAEFLARLEQAGLYELAAEMGVLGVGGELNNSIIEQYTHAIYPHETAGSGQMLLIRFVKPIHLDEFFEEFRIKNEEKTHRGQTYYFNGDEAVYQADERTFVITGSSASSESRIHRLIESGSNPHPAFEQEPAWQAVKQGQIAMLINDQQVLSDLLANMTPQEAFLSSFRTLGKDVDVISAGVRWDEELSARAFAWCKNQQATDDLKDLLEGAEVLGRTWMLAPSAVENGNPELLKIVRELFQALEIRKRGLRVQVQTSIPADRDWAAEILAARQAAKRSTSKNNLKQLALAMHNYYSTYKCLPPPVLMGPDGKTPYSWRVALLPYLEQQALYDAYDFDEPWDGPNNRNVLESMPAVFRHPTVRGDTTTSSYYALVGPESVFDGKKDREMPGGAPNQGVRFIDITDGMSNTLLFVVAKRDIPWTKPEDIPYHVDKPLPELGGFFQAGFYAALCDARVRVRFFPADMGEDVLRAMISKAGRETIDFETMTVRKP